MKKISLMETKIFPTYVKKDLALMMTTKFQKI